MFSIYDNSNITIDISNIDKTEAYIWQCFQQFENINIFLDRGPWPYEKEGRQQTEQEAIAIHEYFENLLKKRQLPYEKHTVGPRQEIDSMVAYILRAAGQPVPTVNTVESTDTEQLNLNQSKMRKTPQKTLSRKKPRLE